MTSVEVLISAKNLEKKHCLTSFHSHGQIVGLSRLWHAPVVIRVLVQPFHKALRPHRVCVGALTESSGKVFEKNLVSFSG